MPQIFIFTAGNSEARRHLANSIQNPIEVAKAKIFDNFNESHHEELQRLKDGPEIVPRSAPRPSHPLWRAWHSRRRRRYPSVRP